MGKATHKEKALYPGIERLMERRGYAVIREFNTFSPLTGRKRKLDLLGFRWTADEDLDAWAVEAKPEALPADALIALGQAIEYQVYVPSVSVAAEVAAENLAFAEPPIRQLGLGYIHATPTSATEIISPASSPRCYQSEFNRVIRHAGVLCLLGRERWKEERGEHHSGGEKTGDADGYPFYAIHNNDPVQFSLSAAGDCKKVRIEIWIDRKPLWQRIYPQIKPDRFAALLDGLDATTTISVFRRDTWGHLGNCLEPPRLLSDQAAIASGLDYARKRLEEDRVVPVMSVALELWAWDAMPRRTEAKNAVVETIERLEPVRAYLAAPLAHAGAPGLRD